MMVNCMGNQENILGDLALPEKYTDPLNIDNCDISTLLSHLRTMLLIRRVEEIIGDGVEKGEIVCPAHLGIGQEAVAVGVSQYLMSDDRVFGAHRSHSHYLALGGSVYRLLAEILGKYDGCSHGMGGSMHLHDPEHGLMGTVPIVAGTVPLAVGAALAAKKDNKSAIAVAYFGDGAAEEGVIHESLNLSAVWDLPILFVCENNLFSSHLHISQRQPLDLVGRFAQAHNITVKTVDGNDVVSVMRASKSLIEDARNNSRPGFLEAVTYRWRGHVGHREDEDVGVNRSKDLLKWKERDPIRRLLTALINNNAISQSEFSNMTDDVENIVSSAWADAGKASYPPVSVLMDYVYAESCK